MDIDLSIHYHYVFRWLDGKANIIAEKHIYAISLDEARKQVDEEWPELDSKLAHIERIKENGQPDILEN